MKKAVIKIFISILCLTIIFSGCSFNSGIAIGRVQRSTGTSWKQSHYLLNGIETRTFLLGKEPLEMEISVVTEEGEIDITVTDKSGEEIMFLDNARTGTYEFIAEGKIKIKIKAEEHRGSFEIKKVDS